VEHSTYGWLPLLDKAVPDPAGEVGHVCRSLPRQRIFHDNSDDESNEDDKHQWQYSSNLVSSMDESDDKNKEEGTGGDTEEEEEGGGERGGTGAQHLQNDELEHWMCIKPGGRAQA